MRNWRSDYCWSTKISISYGSAKDFGKLRSPTYQRGWTWIPSYVWVQHVVSVRKGVNSLEKLLVWGLKFFPGVQPLIHLTSILPWKAWRPLVATYGYPNSANLKMLRCTSSPFVDFTIRRIGGLQNGLRGQILLGAALGMWVRGADLASGSSPPLQWLLSILQNGKFLAGASEKNTETAFQKSSPGDRHQGEDTGEPLSLQSTGCFSRSTVLLGARVLPKPLEKPQPGGGKGGLASSNVWFPRKQWTLPRSACLAVMKS